jgi:hypothetical protein
MRSEKDREGQLQEKSLTHEALSENPGRLRYVPLLSAGVLVFLGLMFLGGLSDLHWHSRTFSWWVPLRPALIGPQTDWVIWCACFIISVAPSVLALARGRTKPDLFLIFLSYIFPLSSLVIASWSLRLGAILLAVSGFLLALTLVVRSRLLLGLERGSALRFVLAEVFAFLSVAATGSLVAILVFGKNAFLALVSGFPQILTIGWVSLLAIDLEAFYLLRPLLSVLLIILAAAAVFALFKEPFLRIAGSIPKRVMNRDSQVSTSLTSVPPGRVTRLHATIPYLILPASVALGVALALYPYTVAKLQVVVGSDSWYYLQRLSSVNGLSDAMPLLQTDRGFFILLLFLIKVITGLNSEWVVKLTPASLSALFALSSFVLVREGTGRSWVASFAALLSVVSAQTALGMSAFIITNWFALSLANFTFALIVRSVRRHSAIAALGSLAVALVLLASYAYMWVVFIAELSLVLIASILAYREAGRLEWKREVGLLSAELLGIILIPLALLFLIVVPFLGVRPQGLDPMAWFDLGWKYVAQTLTPQTLGSSLSALELSFDFAGNRIDLPFLTLLSIPCLFDGKSQTPPFRRIIVVTILVPFIVTMLTTDMYFTWRGLYLIPLYLTGALGAEYIIRQVNGQESPWKSRSRLAFTGTFTAYIFLSQLAYFLRALELLIMVA